MTVHYLSTTLSGASGGTDGSTEVNWPGGPGCFGVQGTFAEATFQLRFQIDGASWDDVPGAELTIVRSDIGGFQLPPCKLRVEWSGGDQNSELTAVTVLVAPSTQGWVHGGNL